MEGILTKYFNVPLKTATLVLVCLALLLLSRYMSCIEIPYGEKINVLSSKKGAFIDFYCVTNRTDIEARVISYSRIDGRYEFKLAISAAPGVKGGCLVEIYGVRPDGSVEKLGKRIIVLKPTKPVAKPSKLMVKRTPHKIPLRGPKPTGIPIFKVKGGNATRYLRDRVGVLYIYGDGYWEEELREGVEYHSYGAEIPRYELNYEVAWDFIEIENVKFFDLLLTAKYTSIIQVVEGTVFRLEYYPGTVTADVYGDVSRYTLSVYHYNISEEDLRKSRTVALDSKYLQVPEELAYELRDLATSLTSDCSCDYDKVKRLVEYLKSNYQYDENVETPADEDPVEYFLFRSKRGVCRHFNSALALLLRSIGIPARVVSGFVVPQGRGERVVTDRERHLWVEVYFEGIGWVSFDATASGPGSCMCESRGMRQLRGEETHPSERHEVLRIVFRPNPVVLRPGETTTVIGELLSDYDVAYVDFGLIWGESLKLIEVRGKTFMFNVTAHETPGEYRISVWATDEMGRVGQGSLKVLIVGSFRIEVSPSSIEIIRGHRATVNLSVIPQGYYPYEVRLSSSWTEGMKTSIEPSKGKLPFKATLSIRVAEDFKPGIWLVMIKGEGEDGAKYENIIEVKVKAETKITVESINPSVVKKGGWILVSGKLTTKRGEPLSDKEVEVFLSANKSLEGAVKIGSAKTLGDGTFIANCTIPVNLKVGNYQVIAVFRGDEFYLNSTSDPTVKVVSELVITANIPSITLAGKLYEVEGEVRDVGGIGVEGIKIVVYLNGTEIRELVSGVNGKLKFNLTFDECGTWVIRLVHPGSDYYLESEAKAVTRTLKVDLNMPSFFIRGVVGNVTGYVYGLKQRDFEAAGINVTLEARLKSYVLTNTSRLLSPSFSVPLLFNGSALLGTYEVIAWLKLGDNLLAIGSSAIPLKAATQLLISAPREVISGENFTVTVKLVDAYYRNITIGGVTVYVNGKAVTLNSTGMATVTYSVPRNYENDTFKLEAYFPGSEYLLPAEKELSIKVKKPTPLPLFLVPVVVVIIAGYAYYARRRKSRSGLEAETSVILPIPVAAPQPYKVKFEFPDLEHPLPPLWAPNEKFRVAVKILKDSEPIEAPVEVYVNGKLLTKSPAFECSFPEEGNYVFEARSKVEGKKVRGRVLVRIARYDEEVIRLYNEVFLSWARDYIDDVGEKTPTEILLEFYSNPNLVKALPSGDGREALKNVEVVTRIFEEAKYSLHPITREKFARFYLSLYKLNLPIGEAYEV